MTLFSFADAKASFNLFCCVYGIGTLGMPGNYARAGPIHATIALIFMAFTNIYATIAVSKCMLHVDHDVKTLGDLGEHCLGKCGRYITVASQMAVCIMVPIAFLVLGSSLLTTLFPDSLSPDVWIVLMALSIIPVSLTPSLKETAGAAFAGCMGTIFADFMSLGIVVWYLKDSGQSIIAPNFKFHEVISCFGNLSLAYGAAVVIPAIQRDHPDPSRMPRVVFFTLFFVSVLFITIAVTAYAFIGCQMPGNLLFAIASDKLGFLSHRGSVVLAFLAMQLHITIAFSVILHPAFYIAERFLLGMHKLKTEDGEIRVVAVDKDEAEVVVDDDGSILQRRRSSLAKLRDLPIISMADVEKLGEVEEPTLRQSCISTIFRIAVITGMVCVAIGLKDNFNSLQEFIGASAVSLSCIILPIIFYMKLFWKMLPVLEKIVCILLVVICSSLAIYLTVVFGTALLTVPDPGRLFPFCPAGYEAVIYTNKTFYHKD